MRPHVAGPNKIIAGVAMEGGVGDADGTVRVRLRRRGVFALACAASVRTTHVGALAYGADDNTVTQTAAGATPVGVIVEADGGSATSVPDRVWVDLDTAAALLD